MKAIIFAAGKGERMRPLTDHTPKPLLTINGKPLIDFHLEKLAKAGFTEIIINLAYKGEMIKNYCGTGDRYGLQIDYSDEGPEPLETGGALNLCLDRFNNEPFAAISADIFTELDFNKLIQRLHAFTASPQVADLVLVPNPIHHPEGDFAIEVGLVNTHGSKRFTYSGIALFKPSFISAFPEKRTIFPLREPLYYWSAQQRVSGWTSDAPWTDVGTPERLHELTLNLPA